MYTTSAHMAIDAIQDAKIKFVESAVKHDGIQSTLKSFIEAQRTYTKSATDAGITAMTSLGMIFTSPKFYTDITEQFKGLMPQKAATKSTKA